MLRVYTAEIASLFYGMMNAVFYKIFTESRSISSIFSLDHLLSKRRQFQKENIGAKIVFCFPEHSFYSDTFNALALHMNANLSALQYCDFPTRKATISQRNV